MTQYFGMTCGKLRILWLKYHILLQQISLENLGRQFDEGVVSLEMFE